MASRRSAAVNVTFGAGVAGRSVSRSTSSVWRSTPGKVRGEGASLGFQGLSPPRPNGRSVSSQASALVASSAPAKRTVTSAEPKPARSKPAISHARAFSLGIPLRA